jgi:hypothetical protein
VFAEVKCEVEEVDSEGGLVQSGDSHVQPRYVLDELGLPYSREGDGMGWSN